MRRAVIEGLAEPGARPLRSPLGGKIFQQPSGGGQPNGGGR
jgi:hypothetical protein